MSMTLAAELASLARRLETVERAAQSRFRSIEGGTLDVYDDDGNLVQRIGVLGDGTAGVETVAGPPPPSPSAPVLEPIQGGLKVTWDGTYADDAAHPGDFAYVEVHASTTPGFTPGPDSFRRTITAAGEALLLLADLVPFSVVLVATTAAGVSSGPSAEAVATPLAVVSAADLAAIQAEVDAAEAAAANAQTAADAANAAAANAEAAATAAQADAAQAVSDAATATAAANSITATQITDGAILTRHLTAGLVSAAELAAGAVVAGKIAAGAVTAGSIAAGAVEAGSIAAGAVVAGSIAADAVTAGTIAAGAVSTGALAAGAVTADKIGANEVTAGKIAANAVTAGTIAAGAVVAGTIAAGAVTADVIGAGTLTNAIDLGATGAIRSLGSPSEGTFVLDGSGLTLTDPSGRPTVMLSAASGAAEFGGALTGGSISLADSAAAGYLDDFSAHPIANFPDAAVPWVVLSQGTAGPASNVITLSGATGGKVVNLVPERNNPTLTTPLVYPWNKPVYYYPQACANVLNGETYVKVRINNLQYDYRHGSHPVVAGMRISGMDAGSEFPVGYYIRVYGLSDTAWFFESPLPNDSTHLNKGQPIQLGAWYHIRLRVVGTTISSKVWKDGLPEPGWDQVANDNTYLLPGIAGLVGSTRNISKMMLGTYTPTPWDAQFDVVDVKNLSGAFNVDWTGNLFVGGSDVTTAPFAVTADGVARLDNVTRVRLAAGTAAVPTLAFASDTDTGLYRSGTNLLSITTGGTEAARFGATGIMAVAGDTAAAPGFSWIGDTNAGMFRAGTDTIGFSTGGAERARINTSELNVGATAAVPSSTSQIGCTINTAGYLAARRASIGLYLNRAGTAGAIASFRYDGSTQVGSISITASATTYATSSDYRLKENVEPLGDALRRLGTLRPVRHTWKAEPDAGAVDGFLAHEVQAVVPEAVTGTKDGEEMQGLDYGRLVPLLVAAVQELRLEVDDLRGRVLV